jgi:L-amino acid N-acyltransferase YncA
MIVRRGSIEDAHRIAAVHVCSWQKAYGEIVDQNYLDALSVAEREARWAEIFNRNKSEVLVAEADGVILGFSSFGRSRDKDVGAKVSELYAIYVTPSNWSKGIGCALWKETYMALVKLGYTSSTVWVLSANQRAIRFYRKAGFALCAGSETIVKIGSQELPEVRYEIAPLLHAQ